MQNIVTETEQDAKVLIDYLRKNRLGRATFLPLNTVRGRTLSAREREVLSLPAASAWPASCAATTRYTAA